MQEREEGHVQVPGGRVWYSRIGGKKSVPVLLLHGGPGAAHNYIASLAEKLSGVRPTIVYDQLGCGRSDRPDDPSLWTIDRAVTEVDAVREALGLDVCYLFGHSWGGWLAIEYMARGAKGIPAVVLASCSASMPQYLSESRHLIDRMPEPHRTALVDLGAQERYEDPSYVAALEEFYKRHLCRLDPWPEVLITSVEDEAENQSYQTMSGPNDLVVVGALRDWDRSRDLRSIDVPTLVTCGRFDEITPTCAETIVAAVPDARLVVFEQSGHLAHLEEPELYGETVAAFLASVDASLRPE